MIIIMNDKAYQIALDELIEKTQNNYYEEIDKKYFAIYDRIDEKFRNIFAFLHNRFNWLFEELNRRSKEKKQDISIIYCKADHSRKLIEAIKMKDHLIKINEGRFKIEFNPNYNKLIQDLFPQLRESNGSNINNYKEIEIIYYEPIFVINNNTFHKQIKNIIFASTGPKPDIVLDDALENNIRIVKNEEYCLVYDEDIVNSNLSIKNLKTWWKKNNSGRVLDRLIKSIEKNDIEKKFFLIYYKIIYEKYHSDELPALLPQVYMHYDPKTIKELKGQRRLLNQRMDFLMLIKGHRIIVELDGVQHYSDEKKQASPKKYADLVKYDRDMKLSGYDVYRFGGYEFTDSEINDKIVDFFEKLLEIYYF